LAVHDSATVTVVISLGAGGPGISDVRDYLRLAENLPDKFTDALLAVPTMQARLRVELRNWRFKRINLGGVGLERESPRLFLSSGSSLLRHKLKEAWDHFLPQARLNGAIFFLDDLQNIASISKADLALTAHQVLSFP